MAKSNFIVRGGADFSGIKKEMQKTQQTMNGFQASINKSMSGVGKALKLGLGYISVKAITGFVKTTTAIASDLTEVQNVVDVTFGAMAKDINDFSKISIEQFGLSELSAKKYSSTMGAMLKSSGIAGAAVRDMSIDLTKLSADMASFYNLDNEAAFQKIMSGMSGMTMPLKELGINMNIANLEAYALAKGIKKPFRNMSQAEQTMLRYNYLLSVTGDAQGDFARNQYTWANQTKILSQQWEILKGTIGQGFINMLMPVVQSFNVLIKKMQVAAAYFKSFTALIFGNAEAGSQGGVAIESMADSLGDAEEGFGDVGKAGKKAAKDLKGSIAGFDEINTLADKSADYMPGVGDGLSNIGGTGVIDLGAASSGEFNIDSNISQVVSKMKEALEPTIEALGRLKAALEPLKTFVSQGLTDFYNSFLVPVGSWVMSEGLPKFVDTISNGLGGINFEAISVAFKNLWDALAPFAINVGEGLLWLWENALVPLGTWTANNVVPAFLDILSGTINIVNNVIDALKPLGQWLWDNFLQPMAGWTGGIIVDVLGKIGDGLNIIGNWISEHKTAVETMAIIVGGFAAAWGLVNLAIGIWNVIGGIATVVTSAFGAAVAFLTSPITLVVLAIGAIIATVVLLIKHWDDVKQVASDTWEGIKEVWEAVATWFDTNVIQPVAKFFTGLWDGISKAASDAWDGITGTWNKVVNWLDEKIIQPVGKFFAGLWDGIKLGFTEAFDFIALGIKEYINAYIWVVEGFVNAFIKGINFIIKSLNKINFSVPDWVPLIGGKSFGFNLGTVNEISIPRLAKGGITDVNNPFVAVVGDNRTQREVISPLDDLRDMIASAVGTAMMGAMQFISSGSNDNREIGIYLEGTKVGRAILPKLNQEIERLGFKPIFQIE